MADRMHSQLLGHLLGALDDDEQQRVDARLEHDEEWCRQLARWRQRLAPLEALRPDFEPPPGLAERTCRYVASYMPTVAELPPSRRRRWMSPHPVPPHRVARVGWLDVAAVALLLVTIGAMIPPAIHGSRYQSRVASCQNDLRQLGLALTDYSQRHDNALSKLADHGRLTRTGVFAAELLQDAYLTATHRTVCPDAWLAVQGTLLGTSHGLKGPTAEAAGPQSPAPPWQLVNDWPDMWPDEMTDGWRPPPSPAESPLLADAPSANLPGQSVLSHNGRGRNVLFEDGHVRFLPSAGSIGAADSFLPQGEEVATRDASVPIVFVSGH